MIISTPPFQPSRMIKTFKRSFKEQIVSHPSKTGRLHVLPIEMIQMAAKAAGVTLTTEAALMTMV